MLKTTNRIEKELEWLKEVDSTSLQRALRNVDEAYKRFFKKQNDQPRFKSRRNKVQSYTRQFVNQNIKIENRKIQLSKLGRVTFAISEK